MKLDDLTDTGFFAGLVLFVCVFLASCLPQPKPTPVPVPDGQATCETACNRMIVLACAAGKPTAEGASCATVCQNVQDSGVVVWNLSCIAAATSCAGADECFQ